MSARKRQPVKVNALTNVLRGRIVSGEWGRGSRIPPRSTLVDELEVSSLTLQRAIDRLVKERFVETFGSNGTRVAERPPHLFDYGLVFPDPKSSSRSHSGLIAKCLELAPEMERLRSGLRMPVYLGGESVRDTKRFEELRVAVETRSLAGLIFVNNPMVFRGTPILDQPGLPRVAISSSNSPAMPVVGFDYRAWITEIAGLVADAGCRRVAVLGGELLMSLEDHHDFAMAEFAERGLRCGPHWWQSVSLNACASAGNVVRLLMHSSKRTERPDAIVIEDDNLLAPTLDGLAALGTRVPEDVRVFSHCNFPLLEVPEVEVSWLGFPVQRALEMCLGSLDAQIRGEVVPPFTAVPPVTADDPLLPLIRVR